VLHNRKIEGLISMSNKSQKSQAKGRRVLLFLFSLLTFVIFLASYFYLTKTTVDTQRQLLRAEAVNATEHINDWLRKLAEIGDRLALTLGRPDCENIEAAILQEIRKNPNVYGIGAAYLPNAHDKKRRLYAPYYVRRGKKHRLIYVEDEYDYSSGDHSWFDLPLKQKKGVWNEPLYGRASNAYLALYSAPIIKTDLDGQQKMVGVVYVNYSLEDIREFMSSLTIGRTGYGSIISSKGAVLYHPRREIVTGSKNIFDLAKTYHSEKLHDIGMKAVAGLSGIEDFQCIFTREKMWFIFEPIKVANWSLNIMAFKDELPLNIDLQRRLLFGALTSGMLLLLSVFGLRPVKWSSVIIDTLVIIAGTMLVMSIVESDRYLEQRLDHKMVDKGSLNKFMDQYRQQCQKRNDAAPPVYVRTGIFIQSIRFSDSQNVVVTGYIWQDYQGVDPTIARGVVLPEAEDVEIEKAYAKDDTVGWHVKINLRERFDYSNYPYDREYVRLRIWHKDFNRNVVLVPDLDAYQFIHPTAKPGIEKDFVLTGWKIRNSFFNYRYNRRNSNLGLKSFHQGEFPELCFNISLKRYFLNPFVAHLIPVFVVILILFFILMVQRKKDPDGLFGFNSLNAVLGCSALFFVVIFNHIALRNTLGSDRIAYLEYFYFVTYLAILYVSANSFLVARFADYNSERSKGMFFPAIFGVLYVLTILEFF
jgi:hypothetical protein